MWTFRGLTFLLAMFTALAGCAHGAPPGFSEGTAWSAPLVSPLEPGGVLLVPVKVHGTGPYLFALDPDLPTTALDVAIADKLELYRIGTMRYLDETDTTRPLVLARVNSLSIGTLEITGDQTVFLVSRGSLAVHGRPVAGILGRNVLADSLVFGFDRGAGRVHLATQEGFTPRQDATTIGFELQPYTERSAEYAFVSPNQSTVLSRRVASLDIGNARMRMHIAFGAWNSRLNPAHWQKAGAAPIDIRALMMDDLAILHRVDKGATTTVRHKAGSADVIILPYGDKRFEYVDGAVGLDAFATTDVMANWHRQTIYLSPRAETAPAERMARWRDILGACADAGCATVAVRGTAVEISRGETEQPLEILIEVTGADGKVLSHKVAVLPAGVPNLFGPIPAGAAQTRIIDVNPFPRVCKGGGGCLVDAAVVP